MIYVIMSAISFIYIGLKSFQQLNVVHGEYKLVIPTSLCLAFCEVIIISTIAVKGDPYLFMPIGLGAGFGCMLSIYLHRRYRRRKDGEL